MSKKHKHNQPHRIPTEDSSDNTEALDTSTDVPAQTEAELMDALMADDTALDQAELQPGQEEPVIIIESEALAEDEIEKVVLLVPSHCTEDEVEGKKESKLLGYDPISGEEVYS